MRARARRAASSSTAATAATSSPTNRTPGVQDTGILGDGRHRALGHVEGRNNGKYTFNLLGLAGVDADNIGVGMGTAQDLAVEHTRQLKVGGVAGQADQLLGKVPAGYVLSTIDMVVMGGSFGGQGWGRCSTTVGYQRRPGSFSWRSSPNRVNTWSMSSTTTVPVCKVSPPVGDKRRFTASK